MQTKEERTFKVGDAVTWTHTLLSGDSMSFRTRSGKVLEEHKTYCIIKKRNGRNETVSKHRLRLASESSEVMEKIVGVTITLTK